MYSKDLKYRSCFIDNVASYLLYSHERSINPFISLSARKQKKKNVSKCQTVALNICDIISYFIDNFRRNF